MEVSRNQLPLAFSLHLGFTHSVPMAQRLLFPDARPLVERLGRDFFLRLPSSPGVYLMRNAAGEVLYVGKAKSLRARLNSYRVANPDRLPRRHLRLLSLVTCIDLEICADELSALAREAELLRSLKPRFNRAGVWSAPRRSLAWRLADSHLALTVTTPDQIDWVFPAQGVSRTLGLRRSLARLLWWAVHPEAGVGGLPVGWFGSWLPEIAEVPWGECREPIQKGFAALADGSAEALCVWVEGRLAGFVDRFAGSALAADLTVLRDWELRSGTGRLPPKGPLVSSLTHPDHAAVLP